MQAINIIHKEPLTKIALGSPNLVKVIVKHFRKETPILAFTSIDSQKEFQNFQLQKKDKKQSYEVSFEVSQSCYLLFKNQKEKKPLVAFYLSPTKTPKVKLSLPVNIESPWSDDKPLNLKIFAESQNPLDKLYLLIRNEGMEKKEKIINIVKEDLKKITTDHTIFFDSYLQSDSAQVELVAVASDRSSPVALVGYSQPIQLKVVSAYGRYRKTLGLLKQAKDLMDSYLKGVLDKVPKEVSSSLEEVAENAFKTPFFDSVDRYSLENFWKVSESLTWQKTADLNRKVGEFLEEHEIQVVLSDVNLEQLNLSNIRLIKEKFNDVNVGLSDHTIGTKAPLYAVLAGASIIEKHFTLDNKFSSFRDHALSLNPKNFKIMVDQIREAEKILGEKRKIILPLEKKNIISMRRSAYASRNLRKGQILKRNDIVYLRPGGGLNEEEVKKILGKMIKVKLNKTSSIKKIYFK